MGFCRDKSLDFLKERGYNVVRHPSAGIEPLHLIGRQNGATSYLGPLNKLDTNPGRLPPIDRNTKAADISGQNSSKLSLSIGANILGSLIGAMGGSLGVNTGYTDAQTVEFIYENVFNDSVAPLEVGDYLRAAEVDAGNLILQQYVMGNGELFLITKTAKSNKFSVKYERKNQTDAKVDVPAVQGLVGGAVKVETAAQQASTVSFTGSDQLVFGFQCFRVGVLEGELTLTSVQPGGVVYAAGKKAGSKAAILVENGLLDLR